MTSKMYNPDPNPNIRLVDIRGYFDLLDYLEIPRKSRDELLSVLKEKGNYFFVELNVLLENKYE